MINVAVLSNPLSTGNKALLPRVRSFCVGHQDVFHYEVEQAEDIAGALRAIASVNPRILVINGGDGTVQATLTGLHLDDPFKGNRPPVAVLPNGKTNLIAMDLGAHGDPIGVLSRIVDLSRRDFATHVVPRELIALTEGDHGNRPVLGMFLGGAGLADTILYCRNQIYPLGLPNGISHTLAAIAVFLSMVFGVRGKYFPPEPKPVQVSLADGASLDPSQQRFAFLIVTTLEKMLFGSRTGGQEGGMRFLAVDQSGLAVFKALFASMRGQLGIVPIKGVHVERGQTIRIESERSSVILDGEEFHALPGQPIMLRSTPPVPFLSLTS